VENQSPYFRGFQDLWRAQIGGGGACDLVINLVNFRIINIELFIEDVLKNWGLCSLCS
jgi:hypothetical protein